MMINENKTPELKGLVLAGGRSSRMGKDKGMIEWHGKPQREYLVDLLESAGLDTYISCRPDQVTELNGYQLIPDRIPDQGPLGAIYSAFETYPDAAWLVVACDMPFVNMSTIEFLIQHRKPEYSGTAFCAPAFEEKTPDPLMAIWEPDIRQLVTQRLKEGQRCARKTLALAGVQLLDPLEPSDMINVNTPQDLETLM